MTDTYFNVREFECWITGPMPKAPSHMSGNEMTAAEAKTYRLYVKGHSIGGIAQRCNWKASTVRTYLNHARQKANDTSPLRMEAQRLTAMETNILNMDKMQMSLFDMAVELNMIPKMVEKVLTRAKAKAA